jgi:hypothetical protein
VARRAGAATDMPRAAMKTRHNTETDCFKPGKFRI